MRSGTSNAVGRLPVAIFLLAFLAFLPSLGGQFLNWDDTENFVDNPGYRGLGWPQIKWMWTTTLMGHYIPVTWMTLGLNFALGGMEPWGYHLGNVLLHAANAVLFSFVTRRLLAARGARGSALAWGAALAALVFAVHPLRTESVAWLTERRDVLHGCFLLLATLAYLKSLEGRATSTGRWRVVSLLTFSAALLSKSSAVMLPVALLILDVYPLERTRTTSWRRLAGEKIPYALLAGAAALVAVLAVRQGASITSYTRYGSGARVAMMAYSFVFYPWKWIWPSGLTPLHELPAHVDLFAWRFAFPTLAFVVVTALLVVIRQRWPAGLAAWTYSSVMLLPMSGLIHSGHQLTHDRYSYMSGLGFAVLAGAGLVWVLAQSAHGRIGLGVLRASVAGIALGLTFLSIETWQQSKVWTDSETLWRGAVAGDPSCSICYSNLGGTLMEMHRSDEAVTAFRQAIALRPDRAPLYDHLGRALGDQGRYADAEHAFQQARRIDPGLMSATANLGTLYERAGRYEEAIRVLRLAYQAKPDVVAIRMNLARVLRERAAETGRAGRLDEAIALLRESLSLSPDDPESLRFLGQAFLAQGRVQDAVGSLERSITFAPSVALSRFWLAKAYRRSGARDKADAEVTALRALDPALAEEIARASR